MCGELLSERLIKDNGVVVVIRGIADTVVGDQDDKIINQVSKEVFDGRN